MQMKRPSMRSSGSLILQAFSLTRVVTEQLSEAAEAADISVERILALAIAEKLDRSIQHVAN